MTFQSFDLTKVSAYYVFIENFSNEWSSDLGLINILNTFLVSEIDFTFVVFQGILISVMIPMSMFKVFGE